MNLAGAGYYKSKMPLGKRKHWKAYNRRARLCPSWPRCASVARGNINDREPNQCGRRPK
jgi:hypothetical protein